MASMNRDERSDGKRTVNLDALKSEIRAALITQKSNACPITMRHAWHMAGTYDKTSRTGGTNGATIRFEPESSDPANAGLSIIRDLLHPVKVAHPEISHADLYVIASAVAIEFLGGPQIPVNFGRTDQPDGRTCPANGRLPDASQGAQHLRDVFGRMGFNDQEIVALSGGHTLGRCHSVRSGFDGPWTTKPLQFDNEYYVNLLRRTWRKRQWKGPEQFEDVESLSLMMLPTDIALIRDPEFRKWVEIYAESSERFFEDFSKAYAKLLALGCPAHIQPHTRAAKPSPQAELNGHFRELAMHGSVLPAKAAVKKGANPHELEGSSGRSALHKAAFWGHTEMTRYLISEVRIKLNTQDYAGDTALHDAARFGHAEVAQLLVSAGIDTTLKNSKGHDAAAVARTHSHAKVHDIITRGRASKL